MFVFVFNGYKKSSGIYVKWDAITRIPKIDQARVASIEGLVTIGRETELDLDGINKTELLDK